MTIEKCKDFIKDGYGTWDDSSKPTTYANMYDYMANQNNIVMNLAKGLWQPSTSYTVGTIIRSPNLPAGCVATCTAPGTSGTTEPKWTAYGTTVTDGAGKWKVKYEGTNASASGGSGNVDMSNYVEKSDYQDAITSLQNSINTKQNTLTFDTTPTAGSSNPVTSDGIKKAIDAKRVDLSNYYTKTQVDSAIASASGGADLSNYYTKAQVDTAISTAISAITDGDNKSY